MDIHKLFLSAVITVLWLVDVSHSVTSQHLDYYGDFSLVAHEEIRASESSSVNTYDRTAPLTTQDVKGHVGQSATLRCKLITHGQDWFVINWHRITSHDDPVLLVGLPVRNKIPEWGTELADDLRSRIRPIITVEKGHVELNMKLSNLSCEDEGEYSCSAVTLQGEIMSTSKLTIKARPQTPIITSIISPHPEGSSLILECKADVGLPPKMFFWFVRPPGEYFTIIEHEHEVWKESKGCRFTSTQIVDVTALGVPRGTDFRCAYPGHLNTPGMFTEYTVDVDLVTSQRPELQEVREEPKIGAVCTGLDCHDSNAPPSDSRNNPTDSGHRLSTWIESAFLCSIICLFHTLWIYA